MEGEGRGDMRRSVFSRPCPRCGEGCLACFEAGRSYAEAKQLIIDRASQYAREEVNQRRGTASDELELWESILDILRGCDE